MATTARGVAGPRPGRLRSWLLEGHPVPKQLPGPHQEPTEHHQHPWWQVMCLTGVDYFSTLGYQPGIAALAAGVLSPDRHADPGAADALRRPADLPPRRPREPARRGLDRHARAPAALVAGQAVRAVLLGFVATDFIITITLSAADATAHIVENPFVPDFLQGQAVAVTLVLIALLGAVFLKGFKEAIGIAVALVAVYLLLNLVVVGVGAACTSLGNPDVVADWQQRCCSPSHRQPAGDGRRRAAGLPQAGAGPVGLRDRRGGDAAGRGATRRHPEQPRGPHPQHAQAADRRRADHERLPDHQQLRHDRADPRRRSSRRAARPTAAPWPTWPTQYLGDGFGTVYDLSTILILWFAGASAMAGLLNIVPRYLPRYGMAPEWTRAARPLVLVFTAIAFAVTLLFRADVEAQGGAYATGVLVLMTSAAVAVTLSARRSGQRPATVGLRRRSRWIFVYTTVVNVIERPDGVKIAAFFIAAIVVTSLVSRACAVDRAARRPRSSWTRPPGGSSTRRAAGEIRIIANQPERARPRRVPAEGARGARGQPHPGRRAGAVPGGHRRDPSEFSRRAHGHGRGGRRLPRAAGREPGGPQRDRRLPAATCATRPASCPHAYFSWAEGNPL